MHSVPCPILFVEWNPNCYKPFGTWDMPKDTTRFLMDFCCQSNRKVICHKTIAGLAACLLANVNYMILLPSYNIYAVNE